MFTVLWILCTMLTRYLASIISLLNCSSLLKFKYRSASTWTELTFTTIVTNLFRLTYVRTFQHTNSHTRGDKILEKCVGLNSRGRPQSDGTPAANDIYDGNITYQPLCPEHHHHHHHHSITTLFSLDVYQLLCGSNRGSLVVRDETFSFIWLHM